MAERDIHKELFEAQQQTITSFVESVERDISANSELAQSLLEHNIWSSMKIPAGAGGGSYCQGETKCLQAPSIRGDSE